MKALLAALLLLSPAGAFAANPSMSKDFQGMMDWLAHEMAQGIAFNAGSTFDPPEEIVDRRLAPDISVGLGHMVLDKTKFPKPETPALVEYGADKIFPASVNFPNFAMHLRGGLPGRTDFAIRLADMTTPPGYKISNNTTGTGQSNSIGFTMRKHMFGQDGDPLLSLGAHYNHVYGRFLYRTQFNVNTQGFDASSEVNGGIAWNVNSYGLNAVVSQRYGRWTPFIGMGYNYVTGSVRTFLEAVPNTPLITPIKGQSSEHPEQNQARLIMGTQMQRSWVNLFANGEIKTVGIGAGKAWVVQFGLALPFHIGKAGRSALLAREKNDMRKEGSGRRIMDSVADEDNQGVARMRRARPTERPKYIPRREVFGGTAPVNRDERTEGTPTMIFIQ
jgi:hypothetical protein